MSPCRYLLDTCAGTAPEVSTYRGDHPRLYPTDSVHPAGVGGLVESAHDAAVHARQQLSLGLVCGVSVDANGDGKSLEP